MRCVIAFLLSLLVCTGASALTVQHISTDAELLTLISDTIFVVEGRIGDRGGAATFELDLGQSTAAPAVTRQYNWQSGVIEPFSLVYDDATGNITFSLGGQTLVYHTPFIQFGDIFVRTQAVYAGTSIAVSDLTLDAESVGDISRAECSWTDSRSRGMRRSRGQEPRRANPTSPFRSRWRSSLSSESKTARGEASRRFSADVLLIRRSGFVRCAIVRRPGKIFWFSGALS
jgi:hypothetical protein